MYALRMFMTDDAPPVRTVMVPTVAEVVPTLQALLERHPNCERIEVSNRGARLFEVDRAGATTPA